MSTTGIPLTNATVLDFSQYRFTPTAAQQQEFEASFKTFLTNQYRQVEDYHAHPSAQPYAHVVVNGQVVATLDNQGGAATFAGFRGNLQGLPSQGDGPQLAQARAEYLARQSGGQVVKANTALDQAAYQALPPLKFRVDTQAMQADPLFQSLSPAAQQALLGLQEV
ncbi:MAG: hypothetical protein INF43_00625 [Alphaproteobacteria bacterium]|nr:hypothetical protein [Alphaproteobacteria bacterium]